LHNITLYTPENSNILINCSFENNITKIEIADTGNGFKEEEIKNLFSKFYRINTKNSGGTGLGLSIVKGFVEAHNGKISVKNNIPKGAKFIFEIPTRTFKLQDVDFLDK